MAAIILFKFVINFSAVRSIHSKLEYQDVVLGGIQFIESEAEIDESIFRFGVKC